MGGWGHDFHAFFEAAKRWRLGEGLYSQELLDAPFASVVGGAYLYPPTLALGLVPGRILEEDHAALLWGGAQQLFLVAAVLLAAYAGGSRRIRMLEAALLIALPVLFWPQMWLLKDGNLGGLLAFLAALGLYKTRLGGGAVALAVAIKLVGATAIPAAVLASRRMAIGLVVGLLVFAAANLILAPTESLEFPRLMMNMLGGDTNNADNQALNQTFAVVLGREADAAGRTASHVVFAALMAFSVIAAWQSRHRTAMCAAMWATLFLSATIWAHYLVIALVPLAAAWQRSGGWTKLVAVVALGSLAANLQLEPGPEHFLTTTVMAWLIVSTSWILWHSESDEPRFDGFLSRFRRSSVG